MDRISKIVNVINTSITSVLGLKGFVYSLCEKNTIEGKTFFVEKKANGVQKGVFLDDSEPLTIIHYTDSTRNETDFEGGFGSSPMIKDTYSNIVLVYIPNCNNELESKKILEKISVSFPSTISKEEKSLLKVKNVSISGSTSLYNKHSIFEEEFPGQIDNLQDNSILLKISYEVVIKLDRACHDLICE